MAEITNHNINKFNTAYEKAKADGAEVFRFENQDVLTAYAKHVIEYFRMKGYLK